MTDQDAFQAYAPISTVTVDIRAARSLDTTDRLAHLTKVGDCARRSFALRILGEAGESLKLESFGHGEEDPHVDTVTLQLIADSGRH